MLTVVIQLQQRHEINSIYSLFLKTFNQQQKYKEQIECSNCVAPVHCSRQLTQTIVTNRQRLADVVASIGHVTARILHNVITLHAACTLTTQVVKFVEEMTVYGKSTVATADSFYSVLV